VQGVVDGAADGHPWPLLLWALELLPRDGVFARWLLLSEADGRSRYCSAMASGQLNDATVASGRARATERHAALRAGQPLV